MKENKFIKYFLISSGCVLLSFPVFMFSSILFMSASIEMNKKYNPDIVQKNAPYEGNLKWTMEYAKNTSLLTTKELNEAFEASKIESDLYFSGLDKIREDREFLIRCWKEDRWRSFKQWYVVNHKVVLMKRVGYVKVPPFSEIELKEIKYLFHL